MVSLHLGYEALNRGVDKPLIGIYCFWFSFSATSYYMALIAELKVMPLCGSVAAIKFCFRVVVVVWRNLFTAISTGKV
ncbi:hypothetical protein Y032_0058g2948 [Ancylostoma ceylanicum]|uniref:Uncharacterized protein n=1 Tax=Ancylostoma ceylanicum TaxID=53326 RepID=A0A016U4F8_9BILA|nr:hypothetical protein Y032_0058g2948 [Ancylostoma ceylanicum]